MLYLLLFFPRTCSVYHREFHIVKQECRNRPVFLTSPVPDSSSIVPLPLVFPPRVVARVLFHACVDCHHFVLLHVKTTTVLGPPSQTHPMARHILSAITTYRKVEPIITHIFLAFLKVLAFVFDHVSSFSVLKRHGLCFCREFSGSKTNLHFQNKRRCGGIAPFFCAELSTALCRFKHLTTRPCLRIAFFLQHSCAFFCRFISASQDLESVPGDTWSGT